MTAPTARLSVAQGVRDPGHELGSEKPKVESQDVPQNAHEQPHRGQSLLVDGGNDGRAHHSADIGLAAGGDEEHRRPQVAYVGGAFLLQFCHWCEAQGQAQQGDQDGGIGSQQAGVDGSIRLRCLSFSPTFPRFQ